MRIDFLIPDFRGGGAQNMVINMANEMAERGHDTKLIVMQDVGPYKNKVGAGVRLKFLNKDRALFSIGSLVKELKADCPEVLYSAMTYMNILAILARLLSCAQTGLVISERNYFSLNAQSGRSPSLLQKLCVFLFYPLADSIVGISKGVATDIGRHMVFAKKKIVVIHNPVVTKDMAAYVAALPFAQNADPVIVTSGRLVAQKDQKTLLMAFAQFHQSHLGSRLIVLGEGPLREELENLSLSLGVGEAVEFKGFVSDPMCHIKKADLFVMSSAWEGFCNVMVEALLCGLPVVSTDCPSGPAEILDNEQYGLLVPVGDALQMAQAMERAMNRNVSAEIQRKRAMNFSVSKICDTYEFLFANIIRERATQ